MANVTDVRYSKKELSSYAIESNSCVTLEKKERVIFLLPSHFADLNAGVRETLDSLLLKYDYLFKAIIIGYGKIKIQSKYGSICYGRSKIALHIEADFYLFNPVVGCKLKGVVCKQSAHHLGCLVYKAFNVSIPLNEDGYISGWDFTIGQDVTFTVIKLDLTSGPLPYIRGQLDDDEIKGKHAGNSGSQIGTDSGFDNGTEDDLDGETEESDHEARPTLGEVTGASLSKVGKAGSKQKKVDKKDVGKVLFLENDGGNVKSALAPQEVKNKTRDSKPTVGEMSEQACSSPRKTKRGDVKCVNDQLGTTMDCDVTGTELKHSEKSDMEESETLQSGEKIKNKSKKKSRESSGKHNSLITQLLKTMEMSFGSEDVGESEGTSIGATPPTKIGKQREPKGSGAKKGGKKNSQRKSLMGVNSPTSVAGTRGDKIMSLLEDSSILQGTVNESIMEASVEARLLDKEEPSPLKKVLTYDNALSPSPRVTESLGATQSGTTEEKTAVQSSFDDKGSKEVLGCAMEGGIVPSINVSPKKESESENIIEKLLGMSKKLLGVSHSHKKNSTRKSTSGVNSPLTGLITEVDKVKPLSKESLLSGGSVDEELEKPTSSKKEGHKKSLSNDDVLSPSPRKRKSVGGKLTGKMKEKTSLDGKVSQMTGSKMEGCGVNLLPKEKSESENIIGELLSINKKMLGFTNIDCSDSSKGKVLGKGKRKRKSMENPGSPPPKVAKLKKSENLEKHEVSDVVKSNFSPP